MAKIVIDSTKTTTSSIITIPVGIKPPLTKGQAEFFKLWLECSPTFKGRLKRLLTKIKLCVRKYI